jgi:hypothetical protein
MTVWLKQSTAATVMVGPIVDSTDGATAETGFTISQADIRLSKNGGAFAQTNNATGATHAENGWYSVPLDTTDTATLGNLLVNIAESGGLQAWRTFMVVPAQVWDSMFGADRLQVHVDEMTADIITAAVLAADVTTELQSGLATAAALATVDGIVDDIKAKTDNLPSDPADASDIAAAFAALNDISSSDVQTAAAAALTAYDPPTKAELDSALAALNDITVAEVLAGGDIDGFTLEEFAKLVLAVLAGKVSGAATDTNVFRAVDDSKARVTSTVDADGNRSAVTLDATG